MFVLHFIDWALRLIFFASRRSTRNECDLIKIPEEASVMLPVTKAAPPPLESRQSVFLLDLNMGSTKGTPQDIPEIALFEGR